MGEWPQTELGPLCSKIGSGATPRGGDKVYLEKGDVALIRSQNVRNDGFKTDGLVYIAAEHADQLANVTVKPQDVLLNITGDSVARCCQVDPRVLPARVNQHVAIIRPHLSELSPRFLRYFLVSPRMQSQMLGWAHAGATRNALTKGMIESFKVPKPPIPVQCRVADVLGKLDDKIELNRRMNRTLEKMAAAIFKSWFIDFDPVHAKAEGRLPALQSGATRRAGAPGLPAEVADLFPDTFEDSALGPIPKGWRISRIEDLCVRVQNGGTPRRSNPEFWEPPTVPWLSSGEVRQSVVTRTNECISELGLQRSSAKWIPSGSTVVALYGATAGQVAFIATSMTTNQAVCALIPKAGYQYFNYLVLSKDAGALANLARGSAQQNISKGIVEATKVVTPAEPIAEAFESTCMPLFHKWISNLRQNDKLAALRDTLLPKLMSGEIGLPASIDAAAQEVQ